MTKREQETKKIDWKNKGLGWIPDYPDRRDYQLDDDKIASDGKLKREEVTGAIEELAENLVETLEFLKKPYQDDFEQLQKIENLIEGLNQKVFGDISFSTIKVHRFLRKGLEQGALLGRFSGENGKLANDILELKKYLYFLLKNGKQDEEDNYYLELSDSLSERLESEVNFDDASSVIRWLRKYEFDPATEQLVITFQCCSNITIDGIVGLETYTALNEYFQYFSNPTENQAKIDEYKSRLNDCKEKCKLVEESGKEEYPIGYKRKTKLIYASSLIPDGVLKLIFDNFEKAFIVNSQDIFEEDFLKDKIELKETYLEIFKDLFQEVYSNVEKQSTGRGKKSEEIVHDFLTALKCKYFSLKVGSQDFDTEKFSEIFYFEFSIIEPIVSVGMKIISPFARFKSQFLEDLVQQGMDDFEKLVNGKRPKFSILGNSSDNSIKDLSNLATKAIQETYYLFRSEIEPFLIERLALESEINRTGGTKEKELLRKKKEDLESTLCFYFFLCKYIKQFGKYNENNLKDEVSIFKKQELFEIELSASKKGGILEKGDIELFQSEELKIPICNSLLKSLKAKGFLEPKSPKPFLFLPGVVDLSYWCSAVENLGSLNACSAFAGIALMEYFANRSNGKYTDISPLFLYKATRNLMGTTGDVGASLRETIKAMALFGVPPEDYWPYEEDKVDEEPPSFCYSYAQNFQALKYFRLDYAGIAKETLLFQIKAVLAAGFPCMFGFTIYTSAYEGSNPEKGYIPYPNFQTDRVVGGHAVVAVGYDDYKEIEPTDRKNPSRGAFLIRNAWGTEWGQGGYGWLPYDYVLAGLTNNWWSLLKAEWFNADSFGLGARNTGTRSWTGQP